MFVLDPAVLTLSTVHVTTKQVQAIPGRAVLLSSSRAESADASKPVPVRVFVTVLYHRAVLRAGDIGTGRSGDDSAAVTNRALSPQRG